VVSRFHEWNIRFRRYHDTTQQLRGQVDHFLGNISAAQ
jgi:hypothetical protein